MAKPNPSKVQDTVGDIFDGVGKYIPTVSVEDTNPVGAGDTAVQFSDDEDDAIIEAAPRADKSNRSTTVCNLERGGKLLFDDKKRYFSSEIEDDENSSNSDIMAPVRAIMRNQYIKEQTLKRQSHGDAASSGAKEIHRKETTIVIQEQGKVKVESCK